MGNLFFSKSKSAHTCMDSFTGTLVYKETTSKDTKDLSGGREALWTIADTFSVEVLIRHSGTEDSHTATFFATRWYGDPGIDTMGRRGVFVLCTFAKP